MSEIRATTVSDLAGTGPAALTGQWASKARVFYDQNTPNVISSENVSSVTDVATGDWNINFTNSFANTTYNEVTSVGTDAVATGLGAGGSDDNRSARTSAILYMTHTNLSATNQDRQRSNAAIFGDLA